MDPTRALMLKQRLRSLAMIFLAGSFSKLFRKDASCRVVGINGTKCLYTSRWLRVLSWKERIESTGSIWARDFSG